jgi:hypothetical protein
MSIATAPSVPYPKAGPMPMEFMVGRPPSPEELELIRSQIESMDKIEAVSDEVRRIVERNWPHLVSMLPPEDK